MNVHNSEQGGLSTSQSSNGSDLTRAKPTASAPERITGNSTNPQTSIVKLWRRNPIVPAGPLIKIAKKESLSLVPKTGSTKSLALLDLNKSKNANQNSTTSIFSKKYDPKQKYESQVGVHPSNNNTNLTSTNPQPSNLGQSLRGLYY